MFPDASVDWDLVEWDPEDTMWEAFAAQRGTSADSPEDTTTKTEVEPSTAARVRQLTLQTS